MFPYKRAMWSGFIGIFIWLWQSTRVKTFDQLMEEETKKIITDLCSSVGAMKADIEMLKNGATNSGPVCKTAT